MLRALMMQRTIAQKEEALAALHDLDAGFESREAELEGAIAEAQTDEERTAMTAEIETFETERSQHLDAVAALEAEIAQLRESLAAEEAKTPAIQKPAKNERSAVPMTITTDIRSLPLTTRAFDALPLEQRQAIVAQDDVKTFLSELRSFKGQKRGITGGDLTIPVVFLDLISQNMYRYSKLLNRVRVREVGGQARQTVAGIVPEAVWTEMCANLNELTFSFGQVTLDGYKVGGWIPVCNALLEDSDIALASWIVEMMSESIGLAKDKAILYGKGSAYHMPLGIVTRLAQESQPESYPATAPAWTDLHTSNIISIDNSLTGAAFWSALQIACGNTFTKYNRGRQFWAMNSKTYAKLKAKAIVATFAGDFVANVYGVLPVIDGDIDILEFMPDNDIVGGYGDLYLWAQREGMTIGMDETGRTNRVLDETVFFGKERADGTPVIAGAFVAINIAGSTPTKTMTFAGDVANTVAGILLPATASVAVGAKLQLPATLQPFGVEAAETWSSATTAKATVDANGVVTGVATGSSVVTVTAAGQTATCTVTCVAAT